jgi:hypothetical protein
MVTKKDAVQIWEDHVGDSGRAPTDDELHAFALAIEEKARKPFVKLQKEWARSSKGLHREANNNSVNGLYEAKLRIKAIEFSRFAQKLKNRLEARN